MSRDIVIDLSAESCEMARIKLEEFQKSIKPKLDEICKRLAEIGIREASAHLAGLSDGNDDVAIEPSPVKISNGYKIVMSGADVYFVEYGTGDQVDMHGNPPSVPVGAKTYSETHAQKLSTYGFWWYGGNQLTGTKAYMPMYYAGKAMRDAFPKVVKEVFKQ